MRDPINRMDASGRLSQRAWLGSGLGVLAIAATAIIGGFAIAGTGGVSAAAIPARKGVVSDGTATAFGVAEKPGPEADFSGSRLEVAGGDREPVDGKAAGSQAQHRGKRAPKTFSNKDLFKTDDIQLKHLDTKGFKKHIKGFTLDDGTNIGGHLDGAGLNKSEFPAGWGDEKIKNQVIMVINKNTMGKPWTESGNGYYVLDADYKNQVAGASRIRIVISRSNTGQPGVMRLVTAFAY